MDKTENIKVSVIVPIYNGDRYLENTLDSILMSTYKNIEIILVDDGSTDKSKEIYSKYIEKDNRIKAYYKKNSGIVESRNLGLKRATGDFVCFCDQDDYVSKDMYRKMINSIEHNNCEVCICSTGRILDKQEISYEKLNDALYKKDEILTNVLYPILFNGYKVEYKNQNARIYGTIWKYMINRELILRNKLEFKKFINYEDDLIMSIEILSCANSVSTMSDMLYFWRINNTSESNQDRYIENLVDKERQLDKYIISILNKRNVNKKIIEKYKEIKELNNYLQIIANENNNAKKKIREKKVYLESYVLNTNGTKNIENIKIISKGYIRSKLLLSLIRFKLFYFVFITDMFLSLIIKLVNKLEWLIKLERKLKGIQ